MLIINWLPQLSFQRIIATISLPRLPHSPALGLKTHKAITKTLTRVVTGLWGKVKRGTNILRLWSKKPKTKSETISLQFP